MPHGERSLEALKSIKELNTRISSWNVSGSRGDMRELHVKVAPEIGLANVGLIG